MKAHDNLSLYKQYLNYSYSELEELLLNTEDKDEKDFYAELCQFYISKRQQKCIEEKPY